MGIKIVGGQRDGVSGESRCLQTPQTPPALSRATGTRLARMQWGQTTMRLSLVLFIVIMIAIFR
jgi:hypothetical protein